jgi:TolB-like protein/Tfp pilus assembly protein PilF
LQRAGVSLLLVAIGAAAAAPGLAWYFWPRERSLPQEGRTPSIAVLPFANLSGDKDNEYFSDGVTDEIINALANVEGLRVVARTSAFSFKGKNVNVRKVAEELNVGTILEGSVRRDGNQVRVAAQLVNAADGYHLWSKSYDRELRNVFALEDELARAIVDALKPRLVRDANLVQRTTQNTQAHDLYLKGRYLWTKRTPESLRSAMRLFEEAIALDPRYALAHSGLSDCYSLLLVYGGAPAAEVLPKAKSYALQAQQIDDTLAEVHASLATVHEHDFDWGAAEREYKRAIELRPGYATAHQWYSILLARLGRVAEARAEAERARQLDPNSFIINTLAGIVAFLNRNYDDAIPPLRKALALDPAWALAREWLVYTHVQRGKPEQGIALLDSAPASRRSALLAARAYALASLGNTSAAQRYLLEAEKQRTIDGGSRGGLALAHIALGDSDGAFAWLAEAVDERDETIQALRVNPAWDPIRGDPRFRDLLKRMNLD